MICCRIILTASSPRRLLICRSLAIRLVVLPPLPSGRERSWRLLLDLNPYGGTDPLCMFPSFLKRAADVMAHCLSVVSACSYGLFLSFLETGQCHPQFRKVHRSPLLSISDRFPKHQYRLMCLSAWCLFVLDDLWNTIVGFQPPSLLIGEVWVPVMHFCAGLIHCKVHWRVGRRLGSCRLFQCSH